MFENKPKLISKWPRNLPLDGKYRRINASPPDLVRALRYSAKVGMPPKWLLAKLDVWPSWFYSKSNDIRKDVILVIWAAYSKYGIRLFIPWSLLNEDLSISINEILRGLYIRAGGRKSPPKEKGKSVPQRTSNPLPEAGYTGFKYVPKDRAQHANRYAPIGSPEWVKLRTEFWETKIRFPSQSNRMYIPKRFDHMPMCMVCGTPKYRLEDESMFKLPIDEGARQAAIDRQPSLYYKIHAAANSGWYTGVDLGRMFPTASPHERRFADARYGEAHPLRCDCDFGEPDLSMYDIPDE